MVVDVTLCENFQFGGGGGKKRRWCAPPFYRHPEQAEADSIHASRPGADQSKGDSSCVYGVLMRLGCLDALSD